MAVANRSPAPTVQNLPDNRASMSLISRSATPTTPFGGFGISCERAAPKEWPFLLQKPVNGSPAYVCRDRSPGTEAAHHVAGGSRRLTIRQGGRHDRTGG